MKIKLLSTVAAVLVSAPASILCFVSGARGETLRIIIVVTLVVSCCTAFTAASLGLRAKKRKETPA